LGTRRQARIIALQTLFEADLVGHAPTGVLARHLEDSPTPEEPASYARWLVEGVTAQSDEIDRLIQQAAPNWPLTQMPKIDKNVLRIAILEALLDNRAVPVGVAINEAVELAKLFGTESSSRFVNGVLGTIAAGGTRRV
jgi:N utilization substance protein B